MKSNIGLQVVRCIYTSLTQCALYPGRNTTAMILQNETSSNQEMHLICDKGLHFLYFPTHWSSYNRYPKNVAKLKLLTWESLGIRQSSVNSWMKSQTTFFVKCFRPTIAHVFAKSRLPRRIFSETGLNLCPKCLMWMALSTLRTRNNQSDPTSYLPNTYLLQAPLWCLPVG